MSTSPVRITSIGTYIPAHRVSNHDRLTDFGLDEEFLRKKLGIAMRAQKAPKEEVSDLCVNAFADLERRANVSRADIDICCVVTQNPDHNIPHTAAIVHHKLGLSKSCMTFDISQGCAGYVHALALVSSLMERLGLGKALVFTCDPYSKIVDPADKATALIFGDAAAVSLLARSGDGYTLVDATFGTDPGTTSCLHTRDGALKMDGTAVLFSATRAVPGSIRSLLDKNGKTTADIDLFLLHPGSKRVVDLIKKELGVEDDKVPFDIAEIGNTVSSSIPLMLAQRLDRKRVEWLVLSGFGVGFTWGTCILQHRAEKENR
ncbi:MAG TPA: ketoacyl-ACP synthase III [Polyangium sp.]|nr:ketoacyl-ACP synthase III [Polyangium sp.]